MFFIVISTMKAKKNFFNRKWAIFLYMPNPSFKKGDASISFSLSDSKKSVTKKIFFNKLPLDGDIHIESPCSIPLHPTPSQPA